MANKIFAIGTHKTGTISLATALNILSFTTSHWDDHEALCHAIKTGNYHIPAIDNHDAILDLPIPSIFSDLDKCYENSKFIYTYREPESWIRSLKNYFGKRRFCYEEFLFHGTWFFNEEHSRKMFLKHHQLVINYFEDRKDDLLIIDIIKGEGWEKLCNFLNKPVPSVPFPHLNKGSYHQTRMEDK